MGGNKPLLNVDTAYGPLEEDRYEAEIKMTDRYQQFTAELLRLALLGIAVFGFLFKEVFLDFDCAKNPNVDIATVKDIAGIAILLFGLCSLSSLVFRYWSVESLRFYLEGLRFAKVGDQDKAKIKLKQRNRRVIICIFSKAIAALSLAFGALLMAFSFFRLL